MKTAVIVPAAGLGTRMGRGSAEKAGISRKQFMLLEGSPILLHTVRKFAASGRAHEIVVAVRSEDIEWVGEMLAREFPRGLARVVEGGNSRQQSVENALATLEPDVDLVAVHDAVRPFVDIETIHKVLDEAAETGAAIVGVVPVDTAGRACDQRCRESAWCWLKLPRYSGMACSRGPSRRRETTPSSAPMKPAWWSAST